MSDKILNYLMITGLVVILAIIGYWKISEPRFSPAPKTTGAILDDTFKQPNAPLEQFYQLMDITPVVNDSFRVDGDFDELALIVTLNEPVTDNQQKFFQWLSDNGYSQIPADKIVLR